MSVEYQDYKIKSPFAFITLSYSTYIYALTGKRIRDISILRIKSLFMSIYLLLFYKIFKNLFDGYSDISGG
jgi:hypothetical protein